MKKAGNDCFFIFMSNEKQFAVKKRDKVKLYPVIFVIYFIIFAII